MIFLLNQCHSKAEKLGGQNMGQSTEKSNFFLWFQQLYQKLGVEGRVALFYDKTLQVGFYIIEA